MKESIYTHTMFIKKHSILVIVLLLLSFKGLSQIFPVQVSPNMIPPYSMKLSDYNTATYEKIMVNLLLTDVTELNRQVGIRMYIENGRNIAIQSSPVVSGAMPIYLDGGVPVRLTNLDLQPYFQFENLQGISPQQYNQPLPDGLYQFCFEVYDWNSGLPISAKSCATAYLVLNDPPILNFPSRGELVAQKDPQNIIFQWTPRHMNATNVQYEFTLTELWDQQMDPQAAFLASRPLYETTTSANTLLYGPAETSLLPDKAYGWRVRAVVTDGISETSVFKNDGYSEIFYFIYTGECDEPAFVLAESEGPTGENIYWQDSGHLKYHVQYRKKALNGSSYYEWFEANAYSNNAKLYNLERGTTYEFRVGGQCTPEGGYSYSQIQEFTTPIDVKSSGYNCGITSEIQITNTQPLPQLFRNEIFTAGDFPVTVKEISGGDGTFSGWGYIVVPYLQDTRIKVKFEGIKINDDYQLINGIVETEYDETWSGVEFANETLEAFEGDLDLTPVQVNFDIDPNNIKDYISINANGELQIEDPATGFVKTYPLGDDYVIKDKNEDGTQDIYYVDQEGNVSYGGQEAEGGPIDVSQTPGFKNGQIENLTATDIKVIFNSKGDYKYGIDGIVTSQKSVLSSHYRTIEDTKGNSYNIIHKAVKNSGNDIIVGEIETDNEELIEKLVFKTAQGGKIEHTINGNKVTLNLKGHFAFEYEDIYATIQEDDNTQTIAGVFTLWHLSQKNVNVAIVPLGNAQIPSNIEAELQSIFGLAAVNLNITKESSLDIESSVWDIENSNNKLDVGERGWFSNYTTEQKAIIKHYERKGGKGNNKYILFITNIAPSRDIEGFMPLKSQHGFIFNSVTKGSEETKENITQVIAHELGHGVFGLEHPFSELKTSQSATDWLMDYAGGITFSHMEWAKMHNPGLQLHLFQNSDEGEYTDTEFADKVFQIIRCAYLNSDENGIISFDTSVFGKTGTFSTEWQGEEIWIKIDNGNFEGMAVYEPVELAKNKENNLPWRYSLLYKNVEIYTPRSSTGADPVELRKLRTYLFPEDKAQFKKETEKILTDFLAKNEFTDKDFEKLKSVANCGIQYFTPKQRYSIIAKIVNNKNITEYYEDLILDLIETSPLKDEADYYNEFLGYLLEKDSEVLEELFADVDDASVTTLWKGRENNYTRFINALANITSIINSDEKKWQIVNHIINSDYGDIEDVEKQGITTILSSMDENSDVVDKVPGISELFLNLLIDDCEELKDYKIIFDIATLQHSNRERFASFTQSEPTVILNNEKVRVTFGKTFFSWVKPVVFTIKELYKDEREIEESELGNYYAWSKFLAEDGNENVADLLDSDPKAYFEILFKQASEYIGEAQTENSDFWANIGTIDCKNRELILNHINANENSNSLKEVSKTKRLDLLVKMFECNWFRVPDVDAVYDYSEDVLIKLVTSFDPTDEEVLQTIENSIGLNKVYDKLYGERLSKFLAWMGSQITSSNYQIELSKEDVFKSEELKDKEDLLMLESDLFSFKNFSIDDIGKNTIQIGSQKLAYNQMVLVYVSGSFTFLGQKFSKGDVLQMPLVQAFAMSNSNRNIAIEKGAWATVDVISLAVGVGSIKIVFSVGNTVRKAIVVSDLLGSSTGLLANALANDAISEETRFQLNMLALVASTPLLATSSKRIDDLITSLDNEISSNVKLDKATKEVLDKHIENIAEKIGTDGLKLGNPNLSDFEQKLQAFINDDVVRRYRKDILESDLQTKFPDLTIEELIAIKLYTNGEKHNGKVIFNTLNSQLRSGKVEEFYVGMDLLLTNSLKKLPQYNSEKVFRGVSGDEANLARTWKKGDEIDFADYKSTSEDITMAAYYNVDNEVVYEIIDPKGASLSSISYYDNEMEVLLYREQKFKVIDVQENFQIDEARNLKTKKFTKITLQAADGSSRIINTNPVKSVPEHAWPAPYPPLAAGQVRIANLQRLKIDRVTGAFQGEVKEAIVDRKVEEILAILNGETTGKQLPIVKMAPDPNTPGGLVLTDQTHTYAAYKRLGFDEIPASIYNESEGVPFLIRQGAYNTENYFPINELQTVPEFSGTPAQQAAKRREALEGKIKNETGSIDASSAPPKSGYTFEKEGYVYAPKTELQPDGSKRIEHFIEKEGERSRIIGHSTLTKSGDLENTLEIPETLRQKEISKAIYAHVLKEDVKRIPTEYGMADGIPSDNLKVFKDEFKKSKDPVQAILETPEGRVLRNDWEPVDIQVKDNEVLFVWVKKGTVPPSPRTGFKYDFEKDGYVYKATEQVLPDGIKRIFHAIKKEGENELSCGVSELTKEGELYNALKIPEKMRNREISKAIYAQVLNEDVKSIPTVYVDGGVVGASDNYTAFIKEYEISKDALKAILGTPEGKVLGKDWEPVDIQVGKSVSFVWIKKGTGSSELNEPWINNLPTELRSQLFKNKDEMYDLFKSADANERVKLAKSWEVLKNAAGLYYQPLMVIKLSTIGEKFHYNGIKGFDALKPLFTTYTTGHPDLNLLSKEMDFINKLSELESLFKSTNDLPVGFSCVKNATYYDPIVLDGSGDVIIKVEAGNIVKNKFFDNVDASYEKVGEFNGFDILRKGDEIGFKSADIININR